MKSLAVKQDFIQRRAQGESYDKIAAALHISKSTCSEWENLYEAEIAQRKQEELNAIYHQYGMLKASRIKRLGQTLEKIDAALDAVDLTQVDPAKLLDMKLKYSAALKDEFTGTTEALLPDIEIVNSPSRVFYLYSEIYARLRNGEISVAQAKLEIETIEKTRIAYRSATEKQRDFFGDELSVEYQDLDDKQSLEDLITELEEEAAEPEDEEQTDD